MDFTETLYGRPNTLKTQECLYRRWIEHAPPPNSEENILKTLKWWESKGLSPRTIKSLLSLLKRYAWFKYSFSIDTKRYSTLVLKKEQKKEIKAFDRESARKIINKLKGDTKTVVMIAYFTGMRKGEIFGLRSEDLDFANQRIFIRRSYNGPTKNGKSRRVRMDEELAMHLLKYIGLNAKLFPSVFDPNPEIKDVCRQLGIMQGTVHSFRHTFATLALDSGKSLKQVQEALGHSSASITMDLYWQNIKGDLELGFL